MLHHDRRRAGSFGEDAERYDRVRPTYPPALVDHLLAESAPAVLDVGCGTGIAAALFRDRGCDVLGVEPDARMATVARRRGIPVEVASFEEWDPGARRFHLLVCGQAWHWIDPERGAVRAAACLAPRGRAALFWNFGTPEPRAREALAALYERLEPELGRTSIVLGQHGDRVAGTGAGLRASGRFAESERHEWPWTRRYTTDAWIEHLLSHSDHQTLDPARRAPLLAGVAAVLDGLGGAFEMAYVTRAVVARVGAP
jgi:SAM-dependent methyltransferase